MADGFDIAMFVCAGLALIGSAIAWTTISNDVLVAEPERRGRAPVPVPDEWSCGVSGPPLRSTS